MLSSRSAEKLVEHQLSFRSWMQILYCAIDQTVPGTTGGSVHVTAVAEGLAALGHEVHVLVTPGDEPFPAAPLEPGALDSDGAAVRREAAALDAHRRGPAHRREAATGGRHRALLQLRRRRHAGGRARPARRRCSR